MGKTEEDILNSIDRLGESLLSNKDRVLSKDARINELEAILLEIYHEATRKVSIKKELIDRIMIVLRNE